MNCPPAALATAFCFGAVSLWPIHTGRYSSKAPPTARECLPRSSICSTSRPLAVHGRSCATGGSTLTAPCSRGGWTNNRASGQGSRGYRATRCWTTSHSAVYRVCAASHCWTSQQGRPACGARMFSSDLEDHAPSWPHFALVILAVLRKTQPTLPSASLHAPTRQNAIAANLVAAPGCLWQKAAANARG